MMSTEDQGYMD